MADVNEGNLTFQADANMHASVYDTDDIEAELDALDAEFADEDVAEPTAAIPSVPGTVPNMPQAMDPISKEDEEIRKLEAGVAL